MKRTTTYILIVIGILVLVNILSDNLFLRLDLTEDKQYTLSNATKDIVRNLEEPVTVTAYFSNDVPAQMAKTKRDFKELLVEYSNLSKGMVVYEFVDPSANEITEQEAIAAGIQPVIATVREKDQAKQQKVFLGAVISMGESSEVIPFMQPGVAMEYALSSTIKKISVFSKPIIGLLQGHGEPTINAFPQAMNSLNILYFVEPVELSDSVDALADYQTIAIVAPKDSFPAKHIAQLDRFLGRGGNIFLAMNRVEGDLTNARGSSVSTGLETWLTSKGLIVENNFIVDARCARISVRQQQGVFSYTTQVPFYYLPIITGFAQHPVSDGLETVLLPFASSLTYTGDTTKVFTRLLWTSEKSGTQPSPVYFDVSRQWVEGDFPLENLTVAGLLEGKLVGNTESKIVVIADGDFAVNGEGQEARQQSDDNISLMVNAIDYLSDHTGLIELRTKGVSSRPLDKELEDGKKAFLKYLNFLLPIILIIIYGVFRMQYNRNLRTKRMEEGYV
ncbi:MAG: Gldg family protein [Bacteroidota bacterium]|nr:Gldg family protein [Bacteroidota bacterium]